MRKALSVFIAVYLVLLLGMWAIAPVPNARAASPWYVAPAAAGGDDAHPGTLAEPFLTIQHAVGMAATGDTIEVAAGEYIEVE